MSSKRQRYTLGHGVYAGRITLGGGDSIRVEYTNEVIRNAVSSLGYLQDAVKYIAARICEEESYNFVQIRSIFHSTTIRNGKKVPDSLGQHLTFTAERHANTVVAESKTGHAYANGIDVTRGTERWYEVIELGRVRWDDERGSSEGSRNTNSTSSIQTAGGDRGPPKGIGPNPIASRPNGWYTDPWTTQSGKAERYHANGNWTDYTRYFEVVC